MQDRTKIARQRPEDGSYGPARAVPARSLWGRTKMQGDE
jgi:hypothetical protein